MRIFVIFFILFFSLFKSQTIVSLYFALDSDVLTEKSKKILDSLSNQKLNLTLRIYGNCDPTGGSAYNKILSEKRTNSVTQYLQKKTNKNIKIASAVGLGDTKQINDNSTNYLRSKNRRVDIFIERSFLSNEKILRKTFPSLLTSNIAQLKPKDTLSLPNVNFYGGRHIWLSNAETTINDLVRIMKENPNLEIEIQGHICCDYDNFDGEDIDFGTFNLSVTRTEAIKNELVKKGISSNRIKTKGMGHLNPIVYPEVSESDKTKNRRVEIMILKK